MPAQAGIQCLPFRASEKHKRPPLDILTNPYTGKGVHHALRRIR
jgi:hypothetical protein